LDKSLSIAQEIGDKNIEGRYYANKGGISIQLSQYPQAISYLDKALSIAQEIGDKSLESSVHIMLGDVYYKQKLYLKALESYQKSLILYSNSAHVLNSIGNTLSKLGRYTEASEYYNQVTKLVGESQ